MILGFHRVKYGFIATEGFCCDLRSQHSADGMGNHRISNYTAVAAKFVFVFLFLFCLSGEVIDAQGALSH